MADRLLIVVPMVAIALLIAFAVQRRRPAAPTQPVEHVAPAQLDRADFPHAEREWLVAAFTSATCAACAEMTEKVLALESDAVATAIIEFATNRELHERYHVTAAPLVVIADDCGVVQKSFFGSTSATHLWAAVAELREPGSVPPGCGEH